MLALHSHSRRAGLLASLVALPLLVLPQPLHAAIRPTVQPQVVSTGVARGNPHLNEERAANNHPLASQTRGRE